MKNSTLNLFADECGGRLYKPFRYCYETVAVQSIQYDDLRKIEAKEKGETENIRGNYVNFSSKLQQNVGMPLFQYFLDGSRRTYKVDDIAISGKIYPIVAGQISVACCERLNPDKFRNVAEVMQRKFVLAVPDKININDRPAREFFGNLKEKFNQQALLQRFSIQFDNVLSYATDFDEKDEKKQTKYEDRAVAKIQNEMVEAEKEVVNLLCKKNKLNNETYLIKDGSLAYSELRTIDKNDRGTERANAFSKMIKNYENVVGVSKSFNPELYKQKNKGSMAEIIAELPLYARTVALRTTFDNNDFAVWYVRIRSISHTDNPFSGVVKVEKILVTQEQKDRGINSEEINLISINLINERNPVCYGADNRWANHLYPVFLTESFVKSQYLSDVFFLNLF
jgi:hypothetical protein